MGKRTRQGVWNLVFKKPFHLLSPLYISQGTGENTLPSTGVVYSAFEATIGTQQLEPAALFPSHVKKGCEQSSLTAVLHLLCFDVNDFRQQAPIETIVPSCSWRRLTTEDGGELSHAKKYPSAFFDAVYQGALLLLIEISHFLFISNLDMYLY